MINQDARLRYAQGRNQGNLASALKEGLVEGLRKAQDGTGNEEVLKLVVKREEEQKVVDLLGKLGDGLALLYKAVTKPLPKIFNIQGNVDVDYLPPVKIQNLKDLEKYFGALEKRIGDLAQAISLMKAPEIKIPEQKVSKTQPIVFDTKPLLDALGDVRDEIKGLSGKETAFPKSISIDNFPPQMVPQPVTNIWLNPLQGVAKTTDNTVGTTATPLPSYGRLFNRRSIIIYNNSSNTIYIGGSDVTTSNGMPVPASSYSPILDAGYNMVVYGIASTSNNDVRVLEVNKDDTSTVQE